MRLLLPRFFQIQSNPALGHGFGISFIQKDEIRGVTNVLYREIFPAKRKWWIHNLVRKRTVLDNGGVAHCYRQRVPQRRVIAKAVGSLLEDECLALGRLHGFKDLVEI